ncbi:maltose alpha-D-glucosyltransferase [Paraflavisolibacter sp. H34]|uniref:maltose alpha-D-glucosyltransferase n=1 Tax=Huijunlia imazamoxiresistens TaxID=3127457 RepID=UPI003018BEAF
MAKNKTILDDKLHWYKDAIIYELHIKAFFDGNNDGIGDFQGLLEKLDYLQDLGVTAIWLLPFYPSPLRDDGYDIADYYSINPSYGNIRQFKQLMKEAHKRQLKVITELVINHTSDQHPWFQRARAARKGSPERDYYVWTDDPNQYKDVRIIFTDYEASNWTWDPVAQQYYWHRFFYHQPDLNYDNPKVQEEIFKIIDYWCDMGVDGFRLDAVPYLYEREGTNGENLPETHAFLKKLRAHIDEKYPGVAFLAEANMWPEDSASYFGDGDECHMNYHFPVMPRMFMALQREDRYPITDIFDQTPDIPEVCQWAMFLRNHDELTLEMVTDEERDYMYKVYAKDPKARINLGIRHRLAPLMENNRRKIELMNSLLFALPGTPVIYYGDEIGMGDNFYLGDRDGVRTPMQWSPDRNAGFSDANPQRLYLPVILDPEYSYESVNVETQRRNTSSLFWYMKRIIAMRRRYKAFSRGDIKFLNVDNPKILAFTRTYKAETLLIVVNLSKFPQPAEIDLSEFKGHIPVEVSSRNRFPAVREDAPYFFTLAAYSFQWFLLQKGQAEVNASTLPRLQADHWDTLLTGEVRTELENSILPSYLQKTKWFTGKDRNIYSVAISHSAVVPLPEKSVYLLLLEVNYESGLPETYQLPVTFATSDAAKKLMDTCPQSIIAGLATLEQEGVLCDALYTTELQQLLFSRMAHHKALSVGETEIEFFGNKDVQHHGKQAEVKPRLISADPANTSITYDNQFFLKLYRKVDRAVNPDLEISRYLANGANFRHTPTFAGYIEWKGPKDSVVLGMMQELVENHGDCRSFMTERINNFIERILARDRATLPVDRKGTLVNPAGFDELPDNQKEFLGPMAADQARLLGIRTAEMHLALASDTAHRDFKPEEFSLHYQRSLFASLQSLVRETFQSLNRNLKKMGDEFKPDVEALAGRKAELLTILKRIYAKKFDVVKTRIHGNYHLGQVLLTGKDLAIQDFSGDPARTYSERRLKRSPLKDVASMICSFGYTAFEGFLLNNQIQKGDLQAMLPFASLWTHYMSGFFVKAYLETVEGSSFIPRDRGELEVLLQTNLLEKALIHLNYELNNRHHMVLVPLRIIRSVLK